MNSLIRHYVEAMFSGLPKTKDITEMKQNIIEHMLDKYEALLARGKSENEALGEVIAEFGSIDEIKKTFGIPDAAEAAKTANAPADNSILFHYEKAYHDFLPKARLAYVIAGVSLASGAVFSLELGSFVGLTLVIAVCVGIIMYFRSRCRDYREMIEHCLTAGETIPFAGTENACPVIEPSCKSENYPRAGRRRKVFYWLLPLIAVIFYLFIGFVGHLWHPGWIIFLCVPLLIGIMEIVRMGSDEK